MLTIDINTARRFILGLWWEDNALGSDAEFDEALARGLARFVTFLGASKLNAAAIREPQLLQRACSCIKVD